MWQSILPGRPIGGAPSPNQNQQRGGGQGEHDGENRYAARQRHWHGLPRLQNGYALRVNIQIAAVLRAGAMKYTHDANGIAPLAIAADKVNLLGLRAGYVAADRVAAVGYGEPGILSAIENIAENFPFVNDRCIVKILRAVDQIVAVDGFAVRECHPGHDKQHEDD